MESWQRVKGIWGFPSLSTDRWIFSGRDSTATLQPNLVRIDLIIIVPYFATAWRSLVETSLAFLSDSWKIVPWRQHLGNRIHFWGFHFGRFHDCPWVNFKVPLWEGCVLLGSQKRTLSSSTPMACGVQGRPKLPRVLAHYLSFFCWLNWIFVVKRTGSGQLACRILNPSAS